MLLFMKKSQIFILDAIFSFFLILIAFGIILSYYYVEVDNSLIFETSSEIVEEMSIINMKDLNDENIRRMFVQKNIENPKSTVLEQVSNFYYLEEFENAKDLTTFFIESISTFPFNAQVIIYDYDSGVKTDGFYLYVNEVSDISLEDSNTRSFLSKQIFGFSSRKEKYEHIIEVIIWQ